MKRSLFFDSDTPSACGGAVHYAQQWALDQGCIQLALDALLDNPASHEFYAKVGFREVERVVFFIKSVVAENHAPKRIDWLKRKFIA